MTPRSQLSVPRIEEQSGKKRERRSLSVTRFPCTLDYYTRSLGCPAPAP